MKGFSEAADKIAEEEESVHVAVTAAVVVVVVEDEEEVELASCGRTLAVLGRWEQEKRWKRSRSRRLVVGGVKLFDDATIIVAVGADSADDEHDADDDDDDNEAEAVSRVKGNVSSGEGVETECRASC